MGEFQLDSLKNSVSVIIPIRNDKDTLPDLIEVIKKDDWLIKEVIIVDGMSTDGTYELALKLASSYPKIRILRNEKKTVPFALNKGISIAKGNFIIRMDAHALYPSHYIRNLLIQLKNLNASNVGPALDTIPADDSSKAKAIAIVLSSKFGVGTSKFRVEQKSNKPIEVDTVPYGCFPIELFEMIGMFDTFLTRNQDDEFNFRIRLNGGKIYLLPWLRVKYFARKDFRSLAKMYFQYGLFKPYILLKYIKMLRLQNLRQFAPALFIISLAISLLLFFFGHKIGLWLFFGFLFVYLTIAFFSCISSLKRKYNRLKLDLVVYCIVSFFIIHFSYGIGYILGFLITVLNRIKKGMYFDPGLSR